MVRTGGNVSTVQAGVMTGCWIKGNLVGSRSAVLDQRGDAGTNPERIGGRYHLQARGGPGGPGKPGAALRGGGVGHKT